MNPSLETTDSPEAIRTEIDQTRQRMDQTINALGERLKGRHLIDEALNLFRTQQENGNMTKFTNQLSTSANSALTSVVDTVKANPVPLALIGAGVAWYLYRRNRGEGAGPDAAYDYGDDYRDYYAQGGYAATSRRQFDHGEETPLTSEYSGGIRGAVDQARTAVEGVGEEIREGAVHLRERAGATLRSAGDKAAEVGAMARDRSQQLYEEGRERVASTVQQHPLETGLVCLALGFVAGLALPASDRVRTAVAPKARELRDRADDMVARGRRVVASGAEALKKEAEAQGLTAKGIAAKAGEVAHKVGDAAKDSARNEGLTPDADSKISRDNPVATT